MWTTDPAWIALVLVRWNATWSAGAVDGEVLDALGLGVLFGVVVLGVGVGVVTGDAEDEPPVVDGDGDDDVASAEAAVPVTRTSPVPTPMISGLRTDRGCTAYNLPNASRPMPTLDLPIGRLPIMRPCQSGSINRARRVVLR